MGERNKIWNTWYYSLLDLQYVEQNLPEGLQDSLL